MKEQRTILVAGGMGGIGRAVARRLAQDGYRIALLYHRTAPAEADAFARSLPNGRHTAYRCDITDSGEVAKMCARVREDHDRLFGCVHAAGGPIVRKALLAIEPDVFAQQLRADLLGCLNVIQAVAPSLQAAREGVIVGITTIFIEPNSRAPRMGAYVPAKYALRGLLREFSAELAPYGVRVNAVAPSIMQTPLSGDLPERVFEFAKEKNPMKSLLTPEELANVVAFLCSDDALAISGVSLPVSYGEAENL